MGIASRREAEKWISDGRLAVNGRVVDQLGTKINTETDHVALDGKTVKAKIPPKVYWLLHKPDKTLTARGDESSDKPTIYDLPMLAKAKFLVSPVGRLDFRTEGLLLLTNDGELSYKLCRPEYHVPREYQVLLDSRLTKEEEQQIKKGITLEDGPVRDVKITYVHGTNMGVSTGSWYLVTVHEGRNRLVRRLFEHFNKRVVRLIRIGFGEIRLPNDLPVGEYRQLSGDEVAVLRSAAAEPKAGGSKRDSSLGKDYKKKRPLRKKISKRSETRDNSQKKLATEQQVASAKTVKKTPPAKAAQPRDHSNKRTLSKPSVTTKKPQTKPSHKRSAESSQKKSSQKRGS